MRAPFLLLGSAALVGCGMNASPDAPDAEASSTTSAVVMVERTTGPGETVRADAVVARFVRVRGTLDEGALRLAGVAQDFPPVGTCSTPSDGAALAPRAIDLLDVGTVSVDDLELGQRVMPDPAGIVSGVFYTKTANDTFVPGARLTLRASGGRDLGDGFTANALAPHEVDGVKATASASAIDVAWDTSELVGDHVTVDVLASSGRIVTRCTVNDVGHATVPASLDEGQVVVHRVHVEPFAARGFDRGEIRFDLARVVAFKR